MLVRIGGGSCQEEVPGDFWAIAGEIASFVETGDDDTLVEFLVGSGMASLYLEGQGGGRGLQSCKGGSVFVAKKGAVFGNEKDLRGQARWGEDGLRFVVPNERTVWGQFTNPTGHDWGEKGVPCMRGSVDGADDIFFNCANGLLTVVRVDLVGGVAPDEVEDCECAAGVCGEPGGGDTEEDVVVHDEGVAGEDAGGDFLAGPAPVNETHVIYDGRQEQAPQRPECPYK